MRILNIMLYVSVFCFGHHVQSADGSLPKQVAKLSQSAPPATPPQTIAVDGFHGLEKKYTRSVSDIAELMPEEPESKSQESDDDDLLFDFDMED